MLAQIGLIMEYVVVIYLLIQITYLFVFSVAGKIAAKKIFPSAKKLHTIRIFIPGYKEDAVIISTAKAAVEHDYPKHLYEVLVIADSFSATTLATLKALPIKVVEVSFEKSTKGKALHKALEATAGDPKDIVVILDADNNMAPGFLHAVNNGFEAGYNVMQGHRTAKNFQTAFAFLDACTEEINNHIFRRGHVAAGLSSALIGSGMAFKYELFIELLENIGETAGEDKEIEFRLCRRKEMIAFLDGHYVYDEKVAGTAVFSKQRSRWLGAQAEFFEKYFIEGWRQLFKGNTGFFDKMLQTFLLPRVMLVALACLWMLWVVFFATTFLWVSLTLFVALALALLMGIPARWYNKELVAAFLQIPGALFSMLKAMLNIGKARKQFIHTPHGEVKQLNH